ncbi:uncharacterized protein LOC127748782 isoform X2 [Frankliniella occidentalis]|uniref:Uncharacterized protein LOC127748782 isoform X2 n=1 Tax=Frankliniella occidentalis TaxID=133901 RepID=A0A9C6U1G0_FRAOC|nr:uncharacterized protein LOC127748782 isoform X2 [Frankliniella occidentalis]
MSDDQHDRSVDYASLPLRSKDPAEAGPPPPRCPRPGCRLHAHRRRSGPWRRGRRSRCRLLVQRAAAAPAAPAPPAPHAPPPPPPSRPGHGDSARPPEAAAEGAVGPRRPLCRRRLHRSDSALNVTTMPGGFENSAMKSSFSLSSLGPALGPELAARLQRPYDSLTKKRRTRDPEQETWRRSWGGKDEFWAALQSDYDYLMDSHLIDTCKEASGDLSVYTSGSSRGSSRDEDWSFAQLSAHFLELYSWLNSIQEAVYGKEETVADRALRTSHMERLQREGFRRRLFNEQSGRLLQRCPELTEEVSWRAQHLNAKWDTLERAMDSPRELGADVEHEVRCLRRWVREMEGRLQPLDLRVGSSWGYQELQQKAKEYLVSGCRDTCVGNGWGSRTWLWPVCRWSCSSTLCWSRY